VSQGANSTQIMADGIVPQSSLSRMTGRPRALFTTMGISGAIVIGFAILAVIGPWIAPHDPLSIAPLQRNLPPLSPGHLLGTDQLGRDTLSRILAGARLSFVIGIAPVAAGTFLGLLTGLLASFGPRRLGFAIMRVMDVAFAFPAIMLALAVAAILGPSLRNAIIAMTIVLIPPVTRITRAAALEVNDRPYIDAARLTGASRARIVWSFGLPNLMAPVVVYAAALCGLMIIYGAGLSFLGVGVQPPTPEWGRMVADGRTTFLQDPWASLIPGACIFIVSLAFNVAADRMRDQLDPRLR
jgi:peptide/nickel transport system permease protein